MATVRLAESGYKKLSRSSSSGTIVDYRDHLSSNYLTQLMNKLKTSTVLNQTEGLFIDFNRKTFGDQATEIYEEFGDAIKNKDKLELMKLCSFSMHEVVLAHLKDPKIPLGFQILENPISSTIRQARIFSLDTHNMNTAVTWHQILVRFEFESSKGGKVFKHNVFERREDEQEQRLWRIAHIE